MSDPVSFQSKPRLCFAGICTPSDRPSSATPTVRFVSISSPAGTAFRDFSARIQVSRFSIRTALNDADNKRRNPTTHINHLIPRTPPFRVLMTGTLDPTSEKSTMAGAPGDVKDRDMVDVVQDVSCEGIDELAVAAEGEERTTWFVWVLVACSTISGLLFGASRAHLAFRFTIELPIRLRLRYRCHIRRSGHHWIRPGSRTFIQWT